METIKSRLGGYDRRDRPVIKVEWADWEFSDEFYPAIILLYRDRFNCGIITRRDGPPANCIFSFDQTLKLIRDDTQNPIMKYCVNVKI